MKVIRILLADDHTIVRAGIRSLLEKTPEFRVVAEAGDGQEALDLTSAHTPDIVVMDIGMPRVNGLDATARLSRDFPKVRVIVLSMHANEEYVARARQAGAAGYLLKRSAVAELDTAIRAVARGERYVSPSLSSAAADLHQVPAEAGASDLKNLTDRQREILRMIAESKNTKEIAIILKVSAKTIEYHRAVLMKRLGIGDVPGLVRFAIKQGLIGTDR